LDQDAGPSAPARDEVPAEVLPKVDPNGCVLPEVDPNGCVLPEVVPMGVSFMKFIPRGVIVRRLLSVYLMKIKKKKSR
jgi:hypothetical protein